MRADGLAALALLLGCAAPPLSPAPTDDDLREVTDDDDPASDDDDDSAFDDDDDNDSVPAPDPIEWPTGPIVEVFDPDAVWDCEQLPGGAPGCVHEYLALASFLDPEVDRETCTDEVTVRVQAWLDGDLPLPPTLEDTPSVDVLADRVDAALALPLLLDGLDERALTVTVRSPAPDMDVLLTDPVVGTFAVRVLLPESGLTESGPTAVPTVLGLPGHPLSDSMVEDFLGEHHGYAYADAGYVVAVVTFRGYDSSFAEHSAVGALLCAGSSLTAVHAYEVLVVERFLRWLGDGDAIGPIALVGHSGGATVGNVVARRSFQFAGHVTDNLTNYLNVQPCSEDPERRCLIDETVPDLFPHHSRINDDHNPEPAVPKHSEDYGYLDGPDGVLDFLAEVFAN